MSAMILASNLCFWSWLVWRRRNTGDRDDDERQTADWGSRGGGIKLIDQIMSLAFGHLVMIQESVEIVPTISR
jgi:hypothetical protein